MTAGASGRETVLARPPLLLGRRESSFALNASNSLVTIALGAVAVVLLLGLVNMMRGGSANTSQRLMRLRVLLQFAAIVVIMGVIWFRSA